MSKRGMLNLFIAVARDSVVEIKYTGHDNWEHTVKVIDAKKFIDYLDAELDRERTIDLMSDLGADRDDD